MPRPKSVRDAEWKDKQIFSPKPQPASGGADNYQIDPAQKLLRVDYIVDPKQYISGLNQVEVNIVKRAPYLPGADIVLEKLEVHVHYS